MADACVESPLCNSDLLMKLQEDRLAWKCENHVQSWINNLTESDLKCRASESSSPLKDSFDGDVFLLLPGQGDNDDLELGAEAKHYNGYNSQSILSPRLSPLISFEDKEVDKVDNDIPSVIENANVSALQLSWASSDLKVLLAAKAFETTPPFPDDNEDIVPIESRDKPPTLGEISLSGSHSTYESWTSSFDDPYSLAAFLYPDAEELLYSLGFCDNSSLLQVIPSRFFQEPSAAFGIDVDEIHNALLMEDEESVYSYDETSSNAIVQRFSESSIDINSLTSSDSTNHFASKKRILFKSSRKDIPSIHLSQGETSPPSPTSVATSSSTSWMRLETLEEVPEPYSRGSSFEMERLSNRAFSALVDASGANLRSALENECNQRKHSDTHSRVETLTDDVNDINNSFDLDINGKNELSKTKLTTLYDYRRSNSDKSCSSVVTVIDTSKKQISFDKPSNCRNAAVVFKPISRDNSLIEESGENDLPEINSVKQDNSFVSKRSLRRLQRSKSIDLTDSELLDEVDVKNITEIDPTDIEIDTSVTRDTAVSGQVLDPLDRVDTSQKPTKSLNDSFREFFGKLKGNTEDSKRTKNNETNKKACIQIIITPPECRIEDSLFLSLDQEYFETNEEHNKSTDFKNPKPSYIAVAIKSILNVLGEYQDSKQSTCVDDVRVDSTKDDNLQTRNEKPNKTNTFFGLFNHQTLSIHSNSAFSSFTAGLIDGEFDIDDSSEHDDIFLNSRHKVTDITHGNIREPSSENNKRELPGEVTTMNSDLSFGRDPVSLKGYIADSPSSDDSQCTCPLAGPKKKRSNKKLYKGNSLESSGFEEERSYIKCPLGKNCFLKHSKNGRHVSNKDSLVCEMDGARKDESLLGNRDFDENSGRTRTNSNASSVMVMTHDHFDFLVQQFTSLRTEMKEQFDRQESRQKEMSMYFTDQLNETKKVVESDYIKWIVKEIESLKMKLKEKDEEIRRLRDMINTKLKSV